MRKEIKRTPITFNGEDGFEVLYEDDELWMQDACYYCMYEKWMDLGGTLAPCNIVHRCGSGTPTYFQFIK